MNKGEISNLCQVCSINRYILTDGASSGLKVIDCTNGDLRFLLNESKSLDIMQVYYKGRNVSFVSKNGFSPLCLSFKKRFEGGMLYTCGLDCVGEMQGHELHGDLHNIPATVTRIECENGGIIVESFMRDSELFGRNLLLKRKVTSFYESNTIEVADILINKGTKEEDFCLLYHVNLGYPALEKGGEILAKVKEVVPRNNLAKNNLHHWNLIDEPKENELENCYFLDMEEGEISYKNKRLKFTLKYSKKTLPNFIVWKSMSCGDYALGLEPTTTELDEKFNYLKIKPKEEKRFKIAIKLSEE